MKPVNFSNDKDCGMRISRCNRAIRSAPLLILLLLSTQLWHCKGTLDRFAKKGTFYLYNLAVTFAPYNVRTGRAGDFHLLWNQGALFLEFGAMVSSLPDAQPLPIFEYRLWKKASVFAMAPGRVTRFVFQPESNDYEIHVRSTVDGDWVVN
jgi:hypothetical protein